jgi:hypothetical protein
MVTSAIEGRLSDLALIDSAKTAGQDGSIKERYECKA